MSFDEYRFDVSRLWATRTPRTRRMPAASAGAQVVELPAPGLTDPMYGTPVEQRCRAVMQSQARSLAANSPTSAPGAIGALVAECAACGRCIGI